MQALKNCCPLFAFSFLILFTTSSCATHQEEFNDTKMHHSSNKMYSKHVQDTFDVSLQYPKSYIADSLGKYPIVLLSDADLYFHILAPIFHQYEEVGIWPPMVLVGLGYGSLERMDSLRNRDFLYPRALASDEMQSEGGGEKFYQFLTQELLPDLQQKGFSNTNRLLMGHSFGGYFALYAYLRQAALKRQDFSNFVAASPSLWYRDFYLSDILRQTQVAIEPQQSSLFMTIGEEENVEWEIAPFRQFYRELDQADQQDSIDMQMYAGAGHMDVGLISFIQGIGIAIKHW